MNTKKKLNKYAVAWEPGKTVIKKLEVIKEEPAKNTVQKEKLELPKHVEPEKPNIELTNNLNNSMQIKSHRQINLDEKKFEKSTIQNIEFTNKNIIGKIPFPGEHVIINETIYRIVFGFEYKKRIKEYLEIKNLMKINNSPIISEIKKTIEYLLFSICVNVQFEGNNYIKYLTLNNDVADCRFVLINDIIIM